MINVVTITNFTFNWLYETGKNKSLQIIEKSEKYLIVI